jgi:hypothetical protein
VSAALDIDTGGGEVLAGAEKFPPTIYILPKVSGTVPDFTVDRYRIRLRERHDRAQPGFSSRRERPLA